MEVVVPRGRGGPCWVLRPWWAVCDGLRDAWESESEAPGPTHGQRREMRRWTARSGR